MKPRAIVAIAVLAAALGAVPMSASGAQARALPVVDMEAVLKAAQWDPRKPDTAVTPGSDDDVLRVEQALQARGLLARQYVDGHFGTVTVRAYGDWQRSLGYTGLAANGIPGETSLTRLGSGRFTPTRIVRPGPRTSIDGWTVNTRTAAMLSEAERLTQVDLRLSQGSFSTSDPTSNGTHAGGGVVDLAVDGWSSTRRTAVTRTLREIGFAAWFRTPAEGDWPNHIHAVAISDPDLAPPAQAQAGDYYQGKNGLRNQLPDTGPVVTPKVTWEEYLRNR